MRGLFGTLAIAALVACDPAPPSYAQYRYPDSTGQQPPSQQQPQPQPPPGAYPNQPPPGYTTTQIQPSYTTTQVQPTNGGSPPPSGPYTTTQVQPGYAPAAPPAAPTMPPPPQPGPETFPPPAGSLASGQYACWQVGMGGYVASNLISVTINSDGTYQVAGYNNGGGTYRADSVSIYLSSGPLNGWVGAIGANAKGPLVRFRPDIPNNPGAEMRQGDHLCFLHF